jgi:hypothetical protein
VIDYPGDTPGRGGWHRNQDGKARVNHPDGGKRICIYDGGSSFWAIHEPYTGPAIYGEQGQQVHDITDCADRHQPLTDELIERGEALGLSREYQNFIYATYITFRKTHGFGEPLHIEKHYVNDAWKVASNIDRVDVLCGMIEFGDTKTATELCKPDYVVQLATMVDGVPYDVETGTRGEWPHPVNRERANIFWLPVRRGMHRDDTLTWFTNDDRSTWPAWELHHVDLVGAVALAQRVVDLRDTDAKPFYTIATPSGDGEQIAAPADGESGDEVAAPSLPLGVEQPATGDVARQMPSPVATPPLVEFFDNINANPIGGSVDVEEITATIRAHRDGPVATLDEARARYRELSDGDKAAVARYWEANDTDLTDADQIIESIGAVQGFHDVAAEPPPPTPAPTPRAALPTVTDEGDTLDEDTIEAAKKRYGALDDAARAWVAHSAAKVRLSPEHGGKATQRRMAIYRGLCELAESDGFDNDNIVKGICVHILGDIVWQGPKVADILGALSLTEASRFARMCDVVTTGDVAIAWTLEGRCEISASVLDGVAA